MTSSNIKKKGRRKKLLIVTDSFIPRWDGISRFLLEIVPSLSKRFRVSIIAPRFKGDRIRFEGVEIIYIPTFNFSLGDYQPPVPARRKIREAIRKNDIIWSQTIGPLGYYAINYSYKKKKKLAAYIHSLEWELYSKGFSRSRFVKNSISYLAKLHAFRCYNKCSLLLVPSKYIKKVLEEQEIESKKIVIHLGTDINKFSPPKSKEKAKRDIGILNNKLIIGYHGRIGREKDIPTLHKAFMLVKQRQPKIMLMIIGEGNKKEERKLKGNNVLNLGRVDNVAPFLKAMDIYALPSLTETSSLSTMEAMAAGLAVATTPVGHLKEYIDDGKNGFLFEPKDHVALARILDRLISDEKLRRRLGRNARKAMMKSYRWATTRRKLVDVLNKL